MADYARQADGRDAVVRERAAALVAEWEREDGAPVAPEWVRAADEWAARSVALDQWEAEAAAFAAGDVCEPIDGPRDVEAVGHRAAKAAAEARWLRAAGVSR